MKLTTLCGGIPDQWVFEINIEHFSITSSKRELTKFSPLFENLIKYSNDSKIYLFGITPIYFLFIWNCFLSNSLTTIPSIDDALEILSLTDYLLTKTINNDISEFLAKNISTSNIFSFTRMARTFNSPRLAKATAGFLALDLFTFYNKDDFNKLHFDQMLDIASSPMPQTKISTMIFINAISKWVLYNPEEQRDEYMGILLEFSGRFPGVFKRLRQKDFMVSSWKKGTTKISYSNFIWASLHPETSFGKMILFENLS